ncbi:LysR family transcriptional regulator [Terrisporobacter sp.]
MNTKQIEYILELSQTLNFNKAAENLFTSQPTISYQIKAVEDEIGFPIFNRSGKGVSLTPAGSQFVVTLRGIMDDLKKAIEQGQNFHSRYKDDIKICIPMRSALYFLPEAIMEFAKIHPSTSITPQFIASGGVDDFLRGEHDILFSYENNLKGVSYINETKLFESHIYLITKKDDPLANNELINMYDLRGRTLMIGGGSPTPLRAVQQRIIKNIDLDYFNSHDHETTLTNVSTDNGVCLSPGFLNDHNGEFAWTLFDCEETISCILYTHSNDQRQSLKDFISILQSIYKKHSDFPL